MRLYYNSVKQSEAPQKGPTLKKSHTGAQLVSFSATSQLNEWWGSTQEKTHSSVTSADSLPLLLVIWRLTPSSTLRLCYNNIRRSEEAQNRPLLGKATQMHNSFPALQERCWKFTLWRSTQEKRLSSVTSATMLALSLVICSSTWWRTLGRSLSSAVKPTHESTCSQSIPEFTRPRSVLFFKCKFYVAKKSFRIIKYFQHNGFDPPEIDICINIPLLHWHKTTTLLQILHNLYWSTDGALGPGIWKNGAKMAIYR